MATAKTTAAPAEDTKAEKAAPAVEAVKARSIEDEGIGPTDPYPTGDPKGPQTWAEINGFVPLGTGPLVPAGG
jgi:hypothetical protein